MKIKLGIKISAVLLAVALLAAGCSGRAPVQESKTSAEGSLVPIMDSNEASSEQLNPGNPAKDFTLTDMDGNTYRLSDFQGQKVYIKLWASWCSICLAGMEEVDQLAGEDNDFVVWTIVSPDNNGEMSKDEFIDWYQGLGNKNMIVLFDDTGDVMKSFGLRGFPTSIYIGSDGNVVKNIPGHNDNAMIKEIMGTIQ